MTIQTLAVEHTLIKQDMLLADMIVPIKAGKTNQHAGILSFSFQRRLLETRSEITKHKICDKITCLSFLLLKHHDT